MLLFCLSLCFLNFSCRKDSVHATVTKNCTGVYLQIGEKYFQVCNKEILDNYADGVVVEVNLKHLSKCKGDPNEVVCMMYFHFDGSIKICKLL